MLPRLLPTPGLVHLEVNATAALHQKEARLNLIDAHQQLKLRKKNKTSVSIATSPTSESGASTCPSCASTLSPRPAKRSIHDLLRELTGEMISEKQLLDTYEFGKVLGSGATSKVYEVIHKETKQRLAFKVFDKASMIEVRRSMGADGDYVTDKAVDRAARRLQKVVSELEILRCLDHPNIVKFHGAIETSHRICVLHELVEGYDLLEYLLNFGKMDETKAASVFQQLLSALQYCHSKNIYHRDLKLENVLVTKDFQVKLIDFGLSERRNSSEDRLHTICGTPLYCSPEVLFLNCNTNRQQGFHGSPADVWSVGVLIFALLTGCAPYDDSSFAHLRADVHRNCIPYPNYMSNEVKGLIKAILSFDPAMRPTVDDLLEYGWIANAQPMTATSPTAASSLNAATSSPCASRCRSLSCVSNNGTEKTSASSSMSYEDLGVCSQEEDETDQDEFHPSGSQEPMCRQSMVRKERELSHLSCLEAELEELILDADREAEAQQQQQQQEHQREQIQEPTST